MEGVLVATEGDREITLKTWLSDPRVQSVQYV